MRNIDKSKIAQTKARVVSTATILSPSTEEDQFILVRLKTIKPDEIKMSISVKILIMVVQIKL